VWAFAPVQDRHAAGAITRALQDLAAIEEVEVVIVARGGGSLADLFAFCDETLCRTVALLRVPVLASVGHHTDRMLIDDVAAVRCSTPTHAAEAAVPCHPLEARAALARSTATLQAHGRRAVVHRARHLAQLARGPAQAVARHRVRLHQLLRELRASARRRVDEERERNRTKGLVLARKARAGSGPDAQTRRAALDGLAAALAAHDPERTIARGYAIVDDGAGNVVTSAAQAREARDVRLFFGDGPVEAQIKEDPE
jgi:exodeoxyribonuclease VII large subunit